MRNARDHRQHQLDRQQQNRRRIAVEAARLMTEHGIRDYHQAKIKAAHSLGLHNENDLPRNGEIEDARREYLRLFQGDTQPALVRHKREVAREAMQFFARFEPRLVGAVLDGSADEHSAVCLHLFSDEPEALQRLLIDQNIPFDESERRLRFADGEVDEFPVYLFSADDVAIDLTVLPSDLQRQAPLDRVTEKPMRRASLGALAVVLKEDETNNA